MAGSRKRPLWLGFSKEKRSLRLCTIFKTAAVKSSGVLDKSLVPVVRAREYLVHGVAK
jgi:hypothetical protein